MRRWKQTKDFKGSLFVEFSTPEEADALLEKAETLRPHRPRKYGLDQRGSKSRQQKSSPAAVVGEKRKRTEGENDSATAEQEAKEEATAAEKEAAGEMVDEKAAASEKEFQAPEKLEDQKLRVERKSVPITVSFSSFPLPLPEFFFCLLSFFFWTVCKTPVSDWSPSFVPRDFDWSGREHFMMMEL